MDISWIFLNYLVISEIFNEFNGVSLAALKPSSPKPQPRPPDNRTIQSLAKYYVDEYFSECTVKRHI